MESQTRKNTLTFEERNWLEASLEESDRDGFESVAELLPKLLRLQRSPFIMTSEGINLRFHGRSDYWITWDRLTTAEQLLGWVYHLSQKRFMTRPLIMRFIEDVSRRQGITLHTC